MNHIDILLKTLSLIRNIILLVTVEVHLDGRSFLEKTTKTSTPRFTSTRDKLWLKRDTLVFPEIYDLHL